MRMLDIKEENEQKFYNKPKENSIELLGEQPLDVHNRDLLNENFKMDPMQLNSHEKLREMSNSPPLVASNKTSHQASK